MSVPNSPTKEISKIPIFFSQTREDSNVEINAIKSLDFNEPSLDCNEPLTICLIASGGDTVCNMISTNENTKIDIIDANPNQIYLTKLKIALMQNFSGSFIQSFLTYGCINYDEILDQMRSSHSLDLDTYHYWLGNSAFIKKGINQIGRFEQVFQSLKSDTIDVVFSHANLTQIFGENATKYSMKRSFVDHFSDVFKKYQMHYPNPKDNYFYYQILYNSYPVDGDKPLYLTNNNPIQITANFNYYHNNMLDHLLKKPNNFYHLIHLSNITDWLNPKIQSEEKWIGTLLNECGRVLKVGGKITLRRLNSDTILESYLQMDYAVNGKYHYQLKSVFDKSMFYSEVIELTKIF